jgi:hypothetical protein
MIADAESGTGFALRESFSGEPDDQDFGRGCLMGHQDLIEVYQLRSSDQMRFPPRLFHCIPKFLLF